MNQRKNRKLPLRNNFRLPRLKISVLKFTNLLIIFQVELVNDSLYEWNVKIMRVDPDSPLAEDLKKLKEREGKDHILLSFTFKVRIHEFPNLKSSSCSRFHEISIRNFHEFFNAPDCFVESTNHRAGITNTKLLIQFFDSIMILIGLTYVFK